MNEEQTKPSQENSPGGRAETLQRWEYKFLYQARGLKAPGVLGSEYFRDASSWDPANFETKIVNLGKEGWELISVVPRSSFGGTIGAGFTSDELWIFKRPKSRIPLSSTEFGIETFGIKPKSFSLEVWQELKRKGYVIYLLEGKSLEELRNESREPLLTNDQLEREDITSKLFWSEVTHPTQVAINPSQVFLPESEDKSFRYHQDMVTTFSEEISKDIKGVKAIIGEASNYVELALLHRVATGERLFKQCDDFFYTATKTLWDDSGKFLVEIGEYSEGLFCNRYTLSLQGNHDTYILPLIVPT